MALLAILLSDFTGIKDDLGEQGDKGREIYVWQKAEIGFPLGRWKGKGLLNDYVKFEFTAVTRQSKAVNAIDNSNDSANEIAICAISTWLETTYNSIHIFNRPRFLVDYSNSYS